MMIKFTAFNNITREEIELAIERLPEHGLTRWKMGEILEQLDKHNDALSYTLAKLQWHDEFLDWLGQNGRVSPLDIQDFFRWKEAEKIVNEMMN